MNFDNFGQKQDNVSVRPTPRKAIQRHEETVSLVNCEQTSLDIVSNVEAKQSPDNNSYERPRLMTD